MRERTLVGFSDTDLGRLLIALDRRPDRWVRHGPAVRGRPGLVAALGTKDFIGPAAKYTGQS